MVLSFVYLAFVSLLKLLIGGGRRVDVKDVELPRLLGVGRGFAGVASAWLRGVGVTDMENGG